jgi:aryl-alcohol dehydrogenase
MRITAALAPEPRAPFQIVEMELDEPRDDEVLVRIAGVGLCHTDLVAQAGALPMSLPAVLGHEGSGIVERVGRAVRKVKPGDAVVLTFMACGRCPACARRASAYCQSMRELNFGGSRSDGSATLRRSGTPVSGSFFGQSSFASHALAHDFNVVKVLEGVPLQIAGPLGCGVQTGAGAVMRSMRCEAGSSLTVLGGGSVGLSAVMGAVVQGCKTIVVVEPHAGRRELALSLGATHAIDPAGPGDLAAAVRAILPAGTDHVLDTSGHAAALQAVPRMLAARGTFGFVGMPASRETVLPGLLVEVMRGGFTYRGIVEGDSEPDEFIPQLMRLHKEGRLPFDRLVKTYPLAAINEAIADQHRGACVKAVLLP